MIIRTVLCLCNLKGRNRVEFRGVNKNIILEWTLRNVLEAGLGWAKQNVIDIHLLPCH
jgi:hypothetical protein